MGGTYYEVMVKELYDYVNKIDNLKLDIIKIDKKIQPDKDNYVKQSKDIRKQIKSINKEYDSKHSELWGLIGAKDYDHSKINAFYKDLNKIHIKHDSIKLEYNKAKKEYQSKVMKDIIAKRNLSKDIPILTEKIFKRIRHK